MNHKWFHVNWLLKDNSLVKYHKEKKTFLIFEFKKYTIDNSFYIVNSFSYCNANINIIWSKKNFFFGIQVTLEIEIV